MAWEAGVGRSKLVDIGRKHKVPLYSTGNYAQYSVINNNGKPIYN